MADSLERELPRMLEEHEAIGAAETRLQAEAAAASTDEWYASRSS